MSKRTEYQEYLKSPSWIAFRNSIMVNSPDCQRCGKRATELHHIMYRRNLSDVRVGDVIPLCHQCHNTVHRGIRVGLIRNPSKLDAKFLDRERENTITTSDEVISKAQSDLQRKDVLPPSVLDGINNLWIQDHKRRCLGILKCSSDELSVLTFSGYRRRKLESFLRWAKCEQKRQSNRRISKMKNPPIKRKKKFKI